MKICVSSKGKLLTEDMDPRFGRCVNFIVYETETGEFEPYANESAVMPGGAGIQAAQFIVSKGVKAAVSGSFGPNAFNTLTAAGVDMFTARGGKVIEVINAFKEGRLEKAAGTGASLKHL